MPCTIPYWEPNQPLPCNFPLSRAYTKKWPRFAFAKGRNNLAINKENDLHQMKMNITHSLVCVTGLLAISAHAEGKWDITKLDMSKLPPAAEQKNVTFAKDIQPILESACVRCHGEQRQKGELRLDSRQAVLDGGKDGKVVVPGDSKSSLLVAAIAQVNDQVAMPPKPRPGDHHGPPPGGGAGPDGAPPGGSPPNDHPADSTAHPAPGRGPGNKALTAAQISLIRAWIDEGAN
jgi:Planctomycete cytochrome C